MSLIYSGSIQWLRGSKVRRSWPEFGNGGRLGVVLEDGTPGGQRLSNVRRSSLAESLEANDGMESPPEQVARPGQRILGSYVLGSADRHREPLPCEWCNQPGCDWSRHPEAVNEVQLLLAGNLPGCEQLRGEPRHDEGLEE